MKANNFGKAFKRRGTKAQVEVERLILSALSRHGYLSISALSRLIDKPYSTVKNRYDWLLSQRLITFGDNPDSLSNSDFLPSLHQRLKAGNNSASDEPDQENP